MGRSKRKFNIAQIKKNSELVYEVKKGDCHILYNYKNSHLILILPDCNRNLAFIPAGYLSKTDAMRQPYSLADEVSCIHNEFQPYSVKNT